MITNSVVPMAKALIASARRGIGIARLQPQNFGKRIVGLAHPFENWRSI
jgi:hypothetical protein